MNTPSLEPTGDHVLALPDFCPVFELENFFETFQGMLRHDQWDSKEAFLLHYQGEFLTLIPDNAELLVIPHMQEYWKRHEVVTYPHQVETVKKVITQLRGKAILADEVGLGKTIEAAMILKEYLLRGLVRRFLILTPAALCRQWEAELHEKFAIDTFIAGGDFEWARHPHIIASLDYAKKQQHRKSLAEIAFDLIIVDEAHKLKSSHTQNWQFVNNLSKKYFLLLTATPLQNDLKELFNLISLLRPGQLGNYRSFRKNFTAGKRQPKNTSELGNLLSEVMIRNRHGVNIGFTKRNVENIPVPPFPLEREMYERITVLIQKCFSKSADRSRLLSLFTLQREICSSTFAAVLTLYKLVQKLDFDDADQAEALALLQLSQQVKQNAKMEVVTQLVKKKPEKVIIFTEFLATQSYIRTRLEQAGILTLAFDGHLSATKKEYTKYQFKQFPQYQVLVCTESGGEGINLQFCNTMINYDLPWNPMRLEQRIGRIHRLGQVRDVFIYNLYTRDTIEEYLLRLLDEKVRMFEVVLGESERVIGKLCQGKSLEARIMELVFQTSSHEQLSLGFQQLGEEISQLLENDQPDEWEKELLGEVRGTHGPDISVYH